MSILTADETYGRPIRVPCARCLNMTEPGARSFLIQLPNDVMAGNSVKNSNFRHSNATLSAPPSESFTIAAPYRTARTARKISAWKP